MREMKVRSTVVFFFQFAMLFLPAPQQSYAADTCVVTLETIAPASPDGSDLTAWTELSPAARHDLIQSKIPWALSGQTRLETKQTIAFPSLGKVRVIALPWSWVPAIELRHLAGRRPDWKMLNRNGGLVFGEMRCPESDSNGLSGGLSQDKYLEVTVHPPGPIEDNENRRNTEINLTAPFPGPLSHLMREGGWRVGRSSLCDQRAGGVSTVGRPRPTVAARHESPISCRRGRASS
jgi:hypothetical protein